MTTNIAPSVTDVSTKGDGSTMLVVWALVTDSVVCLPVSFPEHSDKSIQVDGTFSSASIALTGSNYPVGTVSPVFASLRDPSSTTIAITGAGIKAVLENTVQVQPVSSGGSSSTVTISMLFHYTNPART